MAGPPAAALARSLPLQPRAACAAGPGLSMDRNPTPPSSEAEDEEASGDAVGDTVYSKHWLFSVLTKLIEVRAGGFLRPGRSVRDAHARTRQ